jgi:hypothetical protein
MREVPCTKLGEATGPWERAMVTITDVTTMTICPSRVCVAASPDVYFSKLVQTTYMACKRFPFIQAPLEIERPASPVALMELKPDMETTNRRRRLS